jgi:hypothetical protein
MKCSDARFALAADPNDRDAALLEHAARCASCTAYAGDMQELDRRLRVAMEVPVPAGRASLRRDRYFTRGLALAASVAGVAVLVGLLWTAFPRESLASAVVDHMSHEPDAWLASTVLRGDEVERVLSQAGVRLGPGRLQVTYARQCWFRGHFVPHLVVQTHEGPVTVLLLPAERITRRAAFNEGSYRGTLVPAGRGSIAVLARDGANIDAVAETSLAAVTFLR